MLEASNDAHHLMPSASQPVLMHHLDDLGFSGLRHSPRPLWATQHWQVEGVCAATLEQGAALEHRRQPTEQATQQPFGG
eukprot:15361295-Alexandrium_andersonii.AAC.1